MAALPGLILPLLPIELRLVKAKTEVSHKVNRMPPTPCSLASLAVQLYSHPIAAVLT